ncbi:MAG: amino acid ABC transporter ATP-binding protein [Pseudomonadales bacterium]|jgi:polar amino acid transport system ATP-binding protein|nr:amino acid ABC transporter ATP-binding protein [Pseudomonadales bacterium]HCF74894.1 ectoine/hydroxyectoine ABC transporter ATP-binding protein EhuA [Gammaproteobacteria bacterium]|tara:strand:- start:3983 stop:4738 length:756 start_codon:yes stop_codon:yes gene_type:complete
MPAVSDMPTLLSLESLHKSFGNLEVLRDINLSVDEQEFVFIIGPSGSGKSTLLRCCNRLEEPTKGRIIFDGQDIMGKGVDINQVRQQIGMVFQSFNLYPHMSALGNVCLALKRMMKLNKVQTEQRGLEALEAVGLSDKARAYPNELSGGQQQRVAIARAVALEPKLMLFDEPTSALDPELVGSVLEVMRALRNQGMTMVVVSHEMAFAREAANRVIFMDEGEILEQGPPERLFGSPEHRRTQEFLKRISHH